VKSFFPVIGSLIGILISVFALTSGIGLLFFTDSYMVLIAKYILPFINAVAGICIVASIIIGIPLLISKKTSIWAGIIFSITSTILGFALTLLSLVLIYAAGGKFWTLVSILILPLYPLVAAIAQSLANNWSAVGMLAVNFVIWLLVIAGITFANQRAESA